MRETKRKRLQTKGWKVGTAKQFLQLSQEEEAYIELRLKLAEGLKTRRVGQGLTQVELAKAVRSSQSRVVKMEAGDPTVSLDLLVRSLLVLGTTNRELAQIIARRSVATSRRGSGAASAGRSEAQPRSQAVPCNRWVRRRRCRGIAPQVRLTEDAHCR